MKITQWQKRECINCRRGDNKGGKWGTAKDAKKADADKKYRETRDDLNATEGF